MRWPWGGTAVSTILSPSLHGSVRAGEASPTAQRISAAAWAVLPLKHALALPAPGTSPHVPSSRQGEELQQPPGLAPRLGSVMRQHVLQGGRGCAHVICLFLFACITVNAVNYRNLLSGASCSC